MRKVLAVLGFAFITLVSFTGSAQAGAPPPPPEFLLGKATVNADGRIFVPYYVRGEGIKVAAYRGNGRIDQSFGEDGNWIAPAEEEPGFADLAVQGRKVLALTPNFLYRLNPDGSTDSSFGTDGAVPVIDAGYGDIVTSGKSIFAVGGSRLLKFGPSGEPDTGFGVNGIAPVTSPYGSWGMTSLTLDSTGRIYVAGGHTLARFLPTGQVDPDFGDGGFVESTSWVGSIGDSLLASEDRIMVTTSSPSQGNLLINRFQSSGEPDEIFGAGGTVSLSDLAPGDIYPVKGNRFDVAVTTVGSCFEGCPPEAAISRFVSAGRPDTSWVSSGRMTQPLASDWQGGTTARQADGKTVFVGSQPIGNSKKVRISLVRLDRNGNFDRTFGLGGKIVSPERSVKCEGSRKGYHYMYFGEKFKRTGGLAALVVGSVGPDPITGGRGDDSICGREGNDQIDGRQGRDHLFGQEGRDRIRSRDGFRDLVDCGLGRDIAIVDRRDRVVRCETVRRPGGAG